LDIALDATFLTTLWMVFCRVSSFLLLSPVFSVTQVPLKVRIFFVLALSVCLSQVLVVSGSARAVSNLPELVGMMLGEVIIGGTMAFGVSAAFAALLLGGRLLDLQMGFGVASLVDPSTQEQAPLLGTLLNLTAVMTFFLVDGHLLLLESVAFSLEMQPPGLYSFDLDPRPIVNQFGLMFVYGLVLFAPVIFTLLLVDVGMAVAARTMPQVNMFIVSLPLKILVGFVVFTLTLPLIKDILERLYRDIFVFIEHVLLK
jgi:flagellar biosynthetic protein FliR